MNCPECDRANVKGTCPACGWSREVTSTKKERHIDYLREAQCAFLTGTYRCRWGRWVRHDHPIYCPFHKRALKQEANAGQEQLALLVEEREYIHKLYPFESFLGPEDLARYSLGRVSSGSYNEEDGKKAVVNVPFWYQPMEYQWRVLTGLPVPDKHFWVAAVDAASHAEA